MNACTAKHIHSNFIGTLLTLFLLGLLAACNANPERARLQVQAQEAQAMFQEHCKSAGIKIYRTADNVEGVLLMKLRPEGMNYGDQFRMDDPYGRDLGGDGYIESLVRGSYPSIKNPRPEWPRRLGYRYVEAIDPKDGKRYRYTGSVKSVGKKDANAPNIKSEISRNPNFDLNIYAFVLDKTPAAGPSLRYGVTYDDISTRADREHWIAGSSLKVIDLQNNEVMAERIGYMWDPGQGNDGGGRSPWLIAADYACPGFGWQNPVVRLPGASNQTYQTLDFVENVLIPKI